MRILVVAVAASLCAGPALGSDPLAVAPAPAVVVRDVAGDANAVNGQGSGAGPRDVVTAPASSSGHDIVAVRIVSTGRARAARGRKRFVADGFTVSLEVGATPTSGAYRVVARSAKCDTLLFQFVTGATGSGSYLRHTCTDTGEPPAEFEDLPVPVAVAGRTITWTVKLAGLPRGLGVGTVLEGLSAETLGDAVLVTAPVLDDVVSNATYRLGD